MFDVLASRRHASAIHRVRAPLTHAVGAVRDVWVVGALCVAVGGVTACSGGVSGAENWGDPANGGPGGGQTSVTEPGGGSPTNGGNAGGAAGGGDNGTGGGSGQGSDNTGGVAPGNTTDSPTGPEGAGVSPTASPDPGVPPDPSQYLVPQRIRRLSNVEYANSVRALLGTTDLYEDLLPADVRQRNFTVNQAQTVSSDWNAEVERMAKQVAAKAVTEGALSRLSPCSENTDGCATQFIDSFAGSAFRRSVSDAERTGLLGVYREGAAEGGFSRGAELVIATVLQAPSFLYLTELGNTGGDIVELTGEEIASVLSYVTTQAPPDAALSEAGRTGALSDPGTRVQHARRLMGSEAGKRTLENMILQWFTADWVLTASKDNIPEFNQYKTQFYDESRSFVRAVIDSHQGDFKKLLTADFTVASPEVASYYGLSGSGQVSLSGTPRLGIATGAAFLGGHSAPTTSSPVKRGAAFMRQVLCTDPPDPSTVNLTVAAPPPDPSKSTRDLFTAHSADPTCQACHQTIDPIGFAFEEFDEGGRVRKGPEDNNGYPVDASSSVTIGGTTFTWQNAAEFIRQVADSELSHRCVARTATRFGFAWTNSATELAFVSEWDKMEETQKTQVGEVLVKLIETDLFVQRRSQ